MQSSSIPIVAETPAMVLAQASGELNRDNVEQFFTLIAHIASAPHEAYHKLAKNIQNQYIHYLRYLVNNNENWLLRKNILCRLLMELLQLDLFDHSADASIIKNIYLDVYHDKKLNSLNFESPDDLYDLVNSLKQTNASVERNIIKTKLILPKRAPEIAHLVYLHTSCESALESILLEALVASNVRTAISLYLQGQTIIDASKSPLELQKYAVKIKHYLAKCYLFYALCAATSSSDIEELFQLASDESEKLENDHENVWVFAQIELAKIEYKKGEKNFSYNSKKALDHYQIAQNRMKNIFIRSPLCKQTYKYFFDYITFALIRTLLQRYDVHTLKPSESLQLSRELITHIDSLSPPYKAYFTTTYKVVNENIPILFIDILTEGDNNYLSTQAKVNQLQIAIAEEEKIFFDAKQASSIEHKHTLIAALLDYIEPRYKEYNETQSLIVAKALHRQINKIPSELLEKSYLERFYNLIRNFTTQLQLPKASQTPLTSAAWGKIYFTIIKLIKLIPSHLLYPQEIIETTHLHQLALIYALAKISEIPGFASQKNINYLVKIQLQLKPHIIPPSPNTEKFLDNQRLIAHLLFNYAERITFPQFKFDFMAYAYTALGEIDVSARTSMDLQNLIVINKMRQFADAELVIYNSFPRRDNIEQAKQLSKFGQIKILFNSLIMPAYEHYEKLLLTVMDSKREKIIEYHHDLLDMMIDDLKLKLLKRPHFFSEQLQQQNDNFALRKIFNDDIKPLQWNKSREQFNEAKCSIKKYFARLPHTQGKDPLLLNILNKICLFDYIRKNKYDRDIAPPANNAIQRPRL